MIGISEKQGYQMTDVTTREVAIEIGDLLNVKKVIIESVIKFEKLGVLLYYSKVS